MSHQKFVIIANPRTGSNYIISLLNSHPSITCHSEIFHRDAIYMSGQNIDQGLEERNLNPEIFLNNVYDETQALCAGFKIFDNHNKEALNYVIQSKEIKKIVLYRSNYLAVYSSQKIAEVTQEYVSIHAQNRSSVESTNNSIASQIQIEFDEVDFEKRHRAYVSFYEKVASQINELNQSFLFLRYDECKNKALFDRTFTFLNLNNIVDCKTSFRKQNTSNIIKRFSNPESVRKYLGSINQLDWCHEGFISWK